MKKIVDDFGETCFVSNKSIPHFFVGDFDNKKHLEVGKRKFYKEHAWKDKGFYLFDAVWFDTLDQPVVLVRKRV